jgi:hypothetical protein
MSYRPEPGYIDGFQFSVPNQTQASIVAGAARDSTNQYDIVSGGVLTADITASGANGLDAGMEMADTWYYIFVIDGPTVVPASLLSASPTAPTLPANYTVFRRIGAVRNNSSNNFKRGANAGNGRSREYFFNESEGALRVLNAGNAAAWADVDLSAFVPVTCRRVQLELISNAVGVNLEVRPNGFGVSDGLFHTNGPVAGPGSLPRMACYLLLDAAQIFEYQNSAGGGDSDINNPSYIDEL